MPEITRKTHPRDTPTAMPVVDPPADVEMLGSESDMVNHPKRCRDSKSKNVEGVKKVCLRKV